MKDTCVSPFCFSSNPGDFPALLSPTPHNLQPMDFSGDFASGHVLNNLAQVNPYL